MRTKRIAILAVAVIIILSIGCAVRSKNAPQIDPTTARDLNIAHQLEQNEKDYRAFFTGVGEARRMGILTDSQVEALNVFGRRWKTATENANREWKLYQETKSMEKYDRVQVFISEALRIYLDLISRKAAMLGGGG